MKSEMEKLLSAEAVAQMLALSKRQIFRLNSSGRIPKPVRIGGSVRWKYSEILRWIECGCCCRAEFDIKKEAG